MAGPAEGYVVYFQNGAALGILGSQQDCERGRESDLALRTPAFAHRLGIATDDARTALAKEMSLHARSPIAEYGSRGEHVDRAWSPPAVRPNRLDRGTDRS